MSRIHSIEKFSPTSTDQFFLDNNIWIYLFCPISNAEKHKQKIYSRFLDQIIQRKCPIWVNGLLLSEFANTWLRLDYRLWTIEKDNVAKKFKEHYCKDIRYKNTVSLIKNAIDAILKYSNRSGDDFNSIDLKRVMNNFGLCDFNDAYFREQAIRKKWKIVTDDKDFLLEDGSDLDIITASVRIVNI